MEATYRTQGIILKRQHYREADLRVTTYTLDHGKLSLVARGAKKSKSKLAGHLEPLNSAEMMVVRGRHYDYLGSAIAQNCFSGIKDDFDKIACAASATRTLDLLVKENKPDERIFYLFGDFLNRLGACVDKDDFRPLADFFIFKLLCQLGYQPELTVCVNCRKRIAPGGNRFDFAKSGLVCRDCKTPAGLPISDDCVKILRFASSNDFERIAKLDLSDDLGQELKNVVDNLLNYIL